MKVKATQSRLTLCDLMDCSPPDSSVHGILQTRTLEWLPFPSPADLPDPRIEPRSPALQSGSVPSEPSGKPIWCFLVFISRIQAQAGRSQTQIFLSRQCLTDRKTRSR